MNMRYNVSVRFNTDGIEVDGDTITVGIKSKPERGRANRIKGINAQRELADMLRSWGLHVTVNYSRGMPDIIAKSSHKVAVFASKAYSLSENGTRQRRISMDEIKPEFDYARKKNIPLVIAVKNLLTGKWWMHWISAEELEDFEGLSTPVILSDDSPEAIRTLEESVRSVKEKLVGVG